MVSMPTGLLFKETLQKYVVSLPQANVLRVVIESMGSALWLEEEGGGSVGGSFPTALPMFLHSLRGVCRASYTVAMVTVPTHLFQVKCFA